MMRMHKPRKYISRHMRSHSVARSCNLILLCFGSAISSGCASIPELGAPPSVGPARNYSSLENAASLDEAWPRKDWWTAYGDPQLDALIAEALASAPDLGVAAARLRQAQGFARQAGALLGPAVDATASTGLIQQSENNGVPAQFVPDGWKESAKLGLGFSLDLDLWGRNRAALKAARLDVETADYELDEARLMLATNIASTYADLAKLYSEHDVAAATVRNREAVLRLVADRVAAGLDTQVKLKQAQSRLSAARADFASTEEALALNRNILAALVGDGPDRGLAITRPAIVLDTPRGIPAGASIDLLGRRPDIAAARSIVEAYASRIKVARAAFYPNIDLSGLIGLQSLGFGNLLKGGSTYGNVGPAVTLPLFRSGALAGEYRVTRGRYDEAVARYNGVVVEALKQTADSIVSGEKLADRIGHSRTALANAQDAEELVRQRYENGISTYLEVLGAQETTLQARRVVSQLETRAFIVDIAMIRALGGGYAIPQTQK